MVGGSLPCPRLDVDPGVPALLNQRLRNPHVINSQPHVATKGPRAIIPPRKMSALFVMKPERVRESPALYLVERSAFSLAAHNALLPQLRVMNVPVLGRNVEVSAENYR